MQDSFRNFAESTSKAAGSPWAFCLAAALVLIWAASGPVFSFSSTWQLVINTTTTIVTFIMVFLIQNAQNRDSVALQLKLDELLCAVNGARTAMISIEDLNDEDLKRLQKQFQSMDKDGDPVNGSPRNESGNRTDETDSRPGNSE